jgi:hypothetical protein
MEGKTTIPFSKNRRIARRWLSVTGKPENPDVNISFIQTVVHIMAENFT